MSDDTTRDGRRAAAPEALGLPDDAFSVSVYFETDADAELAVAAFEAAGYEGAVATTVETFCLD